MSFCQNRRRCRAGGRSNPAYPATRGSRRPGCRNRATIAAAALLEGEAEAPTRKAVEVALAGDPTAMRLCLERILPPCRERAVNFVLPSIESPAASAPAMKAVTAALADGVIIPGGGEAIARIVDTFIEAIATSDFERRLKAIEIADRERDEAAAQPGGNYYR
jgi:hypothetical protein